MKRIKYLLILLIGIFVMVGCGDTEYHTYEGINGNQITVKLSSVDGHTLSRKLPIEISLDDEVLTTGTFFHAADYDDQVLRLFSLDGVKVLEEDKDSIGNDYVLYSINDKTFIYLIRIKDCDTAIRLENNINLPNAREVFGKLTFTFRN